MLPRLILLTLVATNGLHVTLTQDNNNPNTLGLKRFVGRLRVGGTNSDVGDCIGAACDSKINDDRDVAKIKFEVDNNSSDVDNLKGDQGDDDEDDYEDDGTAVEEGRGRRKGKKKKGYGKYVVVLAGIAKATMLYIMIHAVAALAGKALIVAKVALAIATALALKKSLDHKTSYEIVKHPQYSSVHTHSQSVDYDHGGGYEGGSRRKRRARR